MLSPEHALLTDCCRQEIETAAVRAEFSSFDDSAYQAIEELARQHGVYPLLYTALKTVEPDTFSAEIALQFKQYNMRMTQRNMLMSAELLQLMQLFKQKDLDAMAFKGPALGQMAYGSVALRQYGDLDILIKRCDIKAALSLLLESGYQPEIALADATLDAFYRCVNVIGLQKGAIRVEIHWELLSKNYAIDWDEEKLWQGHETTEINRKPIRMLSFENHILYLCAHGAKHLFERLEWICDIDRTVRANSNIDFDNLVLMARELGIERMLLLGLGLSQRFFKLPLPSEITLKIEKDPKLEKLMTEVIHLHYFGQKSSKSYSTFWLLWQMREKLGDRVKFAYRALLTPKFDDFRSVQLSGPLLFLYPVIRPLRLLSKYFQKRKQHS